MAKFNKESEKELEALKEHEMYRSRLISFYNEHAPDNLGRVDETLRQWAGKEDELFEQLHRKYLGASEAKRSWPAVSQISNLIVREGRVSFLVRKAAPMVGSLLGWNSEETKRRTRDDWEHACQQ